MCKYMVTGLTNPNLRPLNLLLRLKYDRRATNVQHWVCQNTGGRKLSSAFCNSIVLHIGLDIIYLAFCCYLHHQFFNQQRFRADGILIPVLRQALSVVGNPSTGTLLRFDVQ